jgi:hypothetical protein
MKSKTLVPVALLLAIAVTTVVFGSRWAFGTRTAAQQPTAPEGSIRWSAQQARAAGQNEVDVITAVSYHGPADISEAISSDSILVGQLVNSATSWDETTGSITTWYKFSVLESLAQRPYNPCAECTTPSVPAALLPLSAGQIVVPLSGGSVLMDDVVVEEIVSGFSGFVQGQNYLLFLNLDPSTNIGQLDYGPSGALLVTTQNTFARTIELAEGQLDPISSGLATQYSNSLTQLRAVLNPTNCNQAQQQDCIDNGGTWNSTNCTCRPAFDPCIRKPWLCQ